MQFPSALIFWLILFLLLMLEFSERCGTILLLQLVFLYILRSDNLISGLPKSNKRLFREDKPQIKAVEIYLWLTWVCRRKVLCDQLDELTFKQLFFFFSYSCSMKDFAISLESLKCQISHLVFYKYQLTVPLVYFLSYLEDNKKLYSDTDEYW